MTITVLWGCLAALTLIGAIVVIWTREMTRMLLGLGLFLLGVAGLYAAYGFELLAVAELFVYVGGVLILFLFAVTAIGSDRQGRDIQRTLDLPSLAISIGVGAALFIALRVILPGTGGADATVEQAGAALLGPLLPQFEIVGLLLLAALAAALAVVGDGESR